MKKSLRIISATLIASMMLPLAGCNKKDGPAEVPTEDEFISYLEDKLGASEYEEVLDPDDLENGVYFQSDSYLSPLSVKVRFTSGATFPAAQVYRPFTLMDSLALLSNTNGGLEAYGAESITNYLKASDDMTTPVRSKDSPSRYQEETQSFTCATLLTFEDEDYAKECFEAIIENTFEKRSEIYEDRLNEYENNKMIMVRYPNYLIDKDAEMNDRKVFSLKDLPEDVYSFDKKKNEGHFSYHSEMQWPAVADIYKTRGEPEWISLVQASMNYTLLLKEDRILLIYHLDYYAQNGSQDLYPNDWTSMTFEEDDVLNKLYKKFSVKDPKKIKLEEDLDTQLKFVANFDHSEYYIDAPEIFVGED